METIKSRSNQFVKDARKVRDGKSEGQFFVEGKRLAEELLKSEIKVNQVFVTPAFLEDNTPLAASVGALSSQVNCLSESVFSYLSKTKSPQGIAATCMRPNKGLLRLETGIAESESGFAVLLHKIGNPGNLGAIARSAEAFGAAGLILTKGSADPFSAASVRGSMGSFFRLPVWREAVLNDAIDWAGNNEIRTICADKEATTPLSKIDWPGRSLIVFGSEAHGLTDQERGLIEVEFKILISEKVESLNLAVAAGIVMSAAKNGANAA